jgi:S-adenosylmethionine hydrolase
MESDRNNTARNPIALLTDFGSDSFYVGAMKGAILAVDPDAVIVDITHSITPQSIDEGSYLLARVFDVFPIGTVFVAVVDPGVGTRRRNLIASVMDRYVVGPDNGLLTDIDSVVEIDEVRSIRQSAVARVRKHAAFGDTFLGRDVFAPVAAALARGEPVGALGSQIKVIKRIDIPRVECGKHSIEGTVRYVDRFGNMLTDISGDHIEKTFGKRSLERIGVSVDNKNVAGGIRRYFAQGRDGEFMALLNSWNIVELSVNGGRAVDRFEGLARIDVRLTALCETRLS